MWIGHQFNRSKQLDAALHQKAETAVKNHERANTALQDLLYSFNATTSNVREIRSVMFVQAIHLVKTFMTIF